MTGWYVGQHKDPRGLNELSGPIKYISMTESVNNIMQAHNTLLHVLLCIYAYVQAFNSAKTSLCVCVREKKRERETDTLSGSF